MPTKCTPALFEFPPVESRHVVAGFDGGAITSDAGALLLGQTDRAIRLTERFAACFTDTRSAELVEHQVETMVMQRVVGIALGYEDLNDHDDLRHDPILTVLAAKLEAQRSDCAPLAGKSTLNRLELSRAEPTRYHKISHDPAAIETLTIRYLPLCGLLLVQDTSCCSSASVNHRTVADFCRSTIWTSPDAHRSPAACLPEAKTTPSARFASWFSSRCYRCARRLLRNNRPSRPGV